MTFSEFINTYSKEAYLKYCASNNLEADLDVLVPETKLCALVRAPVLKSAKAQKHKIKTIPL